MTWYQSKTPPAPSTFISEEQLRQHRCCFTGHRPEKLTRTEKEIKDELEEEILLAIQDGFTTFISGMARGVDLWAAEIVLNMRRHYKNLRLICAVPYEGFEERWSLKCQQLYRSILNQADLIRVIAQSYYPGVFQIRNEWLVDHSCRVIAVFNGDRSGTKNTLDYALLQGVPIRVIGG